MRRRILDTSVLIRHWSRRGGNSPADKTVQQARAWAAEVTTTFRSRAIVSPTYLEFVCGTTGADQLVLAEEYLAAFEVVDQWEIRPEDLEEARRLARRVPPDGRRRQLGDCLIRAIAKRLRYEVETFDRGFPR